MGQLFLFVVKEAVSY